MKANITTYATNATIGCGDNSFSVDYDFQGIAFEDDNEVREWIDEQLSSIQDADNYDEIALLLSISLDRYKA